MRISAKGRYALAAMTSIAQQYHSKECVTVISISEKLGISKIYLEQVFSLLKRGGIVTSLKGSQGGYYLARTPEKITLYDILSAVETSLFEPSETTVADKAPDIDAALRYFAFAQLDEAVKAALTGITLEQLSTRAEEYRGDAAVMFYI